jgi:membrane protein DedA with SNARE-associated domain
MLAAFVTWLADTIFRLGYVGILLLMAVESSIVPLPSELVMPPAGYLAAQGRMDVAWAWAVGTGGSVLGALLNYWIAHTLGRPLLHRYSRYLLISEARLDRSEDFFRRHGEISVLLSRLVPVMRHLVSLPAGLARMRLGRFAAYTALGAGIWCAILTAIGWYIGLHAAVLRQADVRHYSTLASAILLPLLAIVVAVYVVQYRRHRAPRSGG